VVQVGVAGVLLLQMLLVGLEILHLEALAKEVTAATVLLLLDMAVEEVVDQAVLVLVL